MKTEILDVYDVEDDLMILGMKCCQTLFFFIHLRINIKGKYFMGSKDYNNEAKRKILIRTFFLITSTHLWVAGKWEPTREKFQPGSWAWNFIAR